jgi:chromosomal replication initiation ATPase DnaA
MTERSPEQFPLPLAFPAAQGAEDFLVSHSNRAAAEWIGRWPDWRFSVLAICGPVGSGKTHLGGIWRRRAGAAKIEAGPISVEQAALAVRAGAVLVDDADRAVGDRAAETALLHLYNMLQADGGRMLITGASPPAAWRFALPDLASRLKTALVAPIAAPDEGLMRAIAVKLLADRRITASEDVIALLLSLGERSAAGIARSIAALDAASLSRKQPISAGLARDILPKLAAAPEDGRRFD